MHYQPYMDAIYKRFSWERCLGFVTEIYNNDHWFRTSSFLKTADFCAETMRRAGLSEVEQMQLKADGTISHGGWVFPTAWDARAARLTLADNPDTVFADYEQIPCSLCMYCPATPPEGVTAEVVIVEDFENAPDVRGKMILTSQSFGKAAALAKKGGAIGILSDFFPYYPGVRDNREQMKGVSRWEGGFIAPKNNPTGIFGFSLSPDKADEIRELVKKDPSVRLHAFVDAGVIEGTLPTISGCIPGTDPDAEEIFLYGHLYEPGANDNASGTGLLLELAFCLNEAIAAGELPRPRRTIRIVMGYECGGSAAYLAYHPERKHCLGVVADMVGAEVADNGVLGLWHDPMSNWSVLDSVASAMMTASRENNQPDFVWKETPFDAGSDNVISDPSRGMPTIGFVVCPTISYHSSMDTPDRMEEKVMHRNAAVVGALAILGASMNENDIPFLTELLHEQIERDCASAPEDKQKLWRYAERKAEAELIALCRGEQPQPVELGFELPAPPNESAARIPVRDRKGTVTGVDAPALAKSQWHPAWSAHMQLPVFWADGNRTLWEIACLYAIEEDQNDFMERLSWLTDYFEVLAEDKILHWKE